MIDGPLTLGVVNQHGPDAVGLVGVNDNDVFIIVHFHHEPVFADGSVVLLTQLIQVLVSSRLVYHGAEVIGFFYFKAFKHRGFQRWRAVDCAARVQRDLVIGRRGQRGALRQLLDGEAYRAGGAWRFRRKLGRLDLGGLDPGRFELRSAALGAVQGDRHAQVKQHVGQRRPLCGFIAFLMRLGKGIQLFDDLPDPCASACHAPHKGQGRVEEHPTGLLQRVPAAFGIRYRLAVRQFNQRIGIAIEQCLEPIPIEHLLTKIHGAAIGP